MRKIKIVSTSEEINSMCGIFPAGLLLKRFGFELLNGLDRSVTKAVEYSSGELLLSYVGMLCLGLRDFYDLEDLRKSRMFKKGLGLEKIASEAALRERLRLKPEFSDALREMNSDTVWDEFKPTAQSLSNGERVVVADLDVSVHENSTAKKRECIGFTYKLVLGFSPAYLYIGKDGYMLDVELRPGEQHCQNGTPGLMLKAMRGAARRGARLLFRMDSGNDSLENILLCHRENHHYIIACNPRGADLSEQILDAELFGERIENTPEKETYIYRENVFHEGVRGGLVKACRVLRLERFFFDEKGEKLLIPEEEISMWWTDLRLPASEIIELYNEHGTSEQYHSEIKTDMDFEQFPSLSFAVNKTVHAAAMIAFNVLRKIGLDAAQIYTDKIVKRKKNVFRKRIKTVILEIMRAAGKLVFSGNVFKLKINSANPNFNIIENLYRAYG